MTVEDEILKELKEHTKYQRATLGMLSEIKFELQNARKLSEASYKIDVNRGIVTKIKYGKPSMWERFRYWVKGKIK